MVELSAFGSPNNNAMHAKPDLRVEIVHDDHFFRLGDLGRYAAFKWMDPANDSFDHNLSNRNYLRWLRQTRFFDSRLSRQDRLELHDRKVES